MTFPLRCDGLVEARFYGASLFGLFTHVKELQIIIGGEAGF
jgi:hypothetical protein